MVTNLWFPENVWNSLIAKWLVAFQKGLSSMELVMAAYFWESVEHTYSVLLNCEVNLIELNLIKQGIGGFYSPCSYTSPTQNRSFLPCPFAVSFYHCIYIRSGWLSMVWIWIDQCWVSWSKLGILNPEGGCCILNYVWLAYCKFPFLYFCHSHL
jgi:hypothetical protein